MDTTLSKGLPWSDLCVSWCSSCSISSNTPMSRKKILWLCSWYPNKTEPYNGDFIQRHAEAASLFNDIHVIHVAGSAQGSLQQNSEEEISRKEGLTEHLIYFRRSTSFWGRLIAHKKWL